MTPSQHPKCKGQQDDQHGRYDCGYFTALDCTECKYGEGDKDPEAALNQVIRVKWTKNK